MKRSFLYAALACAAFWAALGAAAFADEAKPAPKPTCGATVAECQTKVEALEKQVAEATSAYQAAAQQRNAALAARADAELATYLAAQKK